MSMKPPAGGEYQWEEKASGTEQLRRFGPSALIAIVAILFIFQNTEEANFEFLWFNFQWPLWIVLVIAMLVGAVLFWGIARRRRKRKAAESLD